MRILTVKQAAAEERRQKSTMIILFSLCFIGLLYAGYDYLQIMNRTSLPEDLTKMDQIVQRWKAEGVVESFDVEGAKLVVNEKKWDGWRREEKVGIITQLGRYCAERKKSDDWALKVVGYRTSAVLGELGKRGLNLN